MWSRNAMQPATVGWWERPRSSRVAAMLVVAFAFLVQPPDAMADGPCELKGGEARTVVVVHDGETVQLDDGQEVRLVGALTPRGSDAAVSLDLWLPAQAAKTEIEGLVLGKSVGIGAGGAQRGPLRPAAGTHFPSRGAVKTAGFKGLC